MQHLGIGPDFGFFAQLTEDSGQQQFFLACLQLGLDRLAFGPIDIAFAFAGIKNLVQGKAVSFWENLLGEDAAPQAAKGITAERVRQAGGCSGSLDITRLFFLYPFRPGAGF